MINEYNLVKQWVSDTSSVSIDSIDLALESLKNYPPSGANQCLIGALLSAKENQIEAANMLIFRYEEQS